MLIEMKIEMYLNNFICHYLFKRLLVPSECCPSLLLWCKEICVVSNRKNFPSLKGRISTATAAKARQTLSSETRENMRRHSCWVIIFIAVSTGLHKAIDLIMRYWPIFPVKTRFVWASHQSSPVNPLTVMFGVGSGLSAAAKSTHLLHSAKLPFSRHFMLFNCLQDLLFWKGPSRYSLELTRFYYNL